MTRLRMLPEFHHAAPQTLRKACSLLEEYAGTAQVLAGGTDLLVGMKYGTENLSKERPSASIFDTCGAGTFTSKTQPPSPDDSRTTSPAAAEASPGPPPVTTAGGTAASSVAPGLGAAEGPPAGDGAASGVGKAASGPAPHAATTPSNTIRITFRIFPLIMTLIFRKRRKNTIPEPK